MEILLLTTPTQHRSANPAVELNPKLLEQWARALPVSDVVRTVMALSHAIESFNELHLGDKERLKLLEIYYTAFDQILPVYDELRLRQLPLTDTAREALGIDIMWLYLHLANGYKIIVSNTFRARRAPKLHPPCISAIYRSMELICLASLYSQRATQTVPPLTYLELNQLYLFAQCADLLTTPLRKLQKCDGPPTIDRIYKQFLLLNLYSTAVDHVDQIHEIHQALERFASQAVISNRPLSNNYNHRYLIEYFEDQPPKPLGAKYHAAESRQATLDITPSLLNIQQWLEQTPTATDALFYENERRLLPNFIKAFEHNTSVLHTNVSRQLHGPVSLIVGLDPILYYLSEGETTAMIAATIYEGATNFVELNTQHPYLSVEPGEIVGLTFPGKKSLTLGFVDHIARSPANSVLQLRLLKGHPEPIFYLLRENTTPLHGLYFPKSTRGNNHASLLTVKALLNHHAPLMVSIHGCTYTVNIGEALLETVSYAQFRFTVIGKTLSKTYNYGTSD